MSEAGASMQSQLVERLEGVEAHASDYFRRIDEVRAESFVRMPRSEGDGHIFDSTGFELDKSILMNRTLGAEIFEKIDESSRKQGRSFKQVLGDEFSQPNHGLIGEYFSLEKTHQEMARMEAEQASRNNLQEVLQNWRVGGLIKTSVRASAIVAGNLSDRAEGWTRGRAKEVASYAIPIAIGAAIGGPIGAIGTVAVIGLAKLSGHQNRVGEVCAQTAAHALSLTAKMAEVGFIGIEKTMDFASRLAKRRNDAGGGSTAKLEGGSSPKPKI